MRGRFNPFPFVSGNIQGLSLGSRSGCESCCWWNFIINCTSHPAQYGMSRRDIVSGYKVPAYAQSTKSAPQVKSAPKAHTYQTRSPDPKIFLRRWVSTARPMESEEVFPESSSTEINPSVELKFKERATCVIGDLHLPGEGLSNDFMGVPVLQNGHFICYKGRTRSCAFDTNNTNKDAIERCTSNAID